MENRGVGCEVFTSSILSRMRAFRNEYGTKIVSRPGYEYGEKRSFNSIGYAYCARSQYAFSIHSITLYLMP